MPRASPKIGLSAILSRTPGVSCSSQIMEQLKERKIPGLKDRQQTCSLFNLSDAHLVL